MQFLTEDAMSTDISVVPLTWIVENSCYWPRQSKNLRTQIIKKTFPGDDWIQYDCKIINTFGMNFLFSTLSN